MSTLRNPVGPEKRGVYIRRRIMVIAVPLAIVGIALLFIFKPGSSGGAAAAPEVTVPDEILAGEQQTDTSQLPKCPAGELEVTPITDLASYASGEQPLLSMRIENIGDQACQAELGTASLSFRITSGPDEVWRSTDCQVDPDQRAVILEPDEPLTTEPIAWDRTRSSTGTCDVARDPVVAEGSTYHLHAAAAGVPSAGTAPFLLY